MMPLSVGHFLTRCQVFPDCKDHEGGIQSLFKVEAGSGLDHQLKVGAIGLNRAAERHADMETRPSDYVA